MRLSTILGASAGLAILAGVIAIGAGLIGIACLVAALLLITLFLLFRRAGSSGRK